MRILILFIFLIIVTSCTGIVEKTDPLTQEKVMQTFTQENRGIDLSSMNLSGFISLNGLSGDEEIVNINVSNNSIEVLNISEYPDLLRIVADNNAIVYFNDIKYPKDIKHISLAGNNLEGLEGINTLTELVTLDVSNNKLDEDDFEDLANLQNLKLIYAQGNDVSREFLDKLIIFNAGYLGRIK